tara:strand:- start:89 stop:349 length:261 start_codon:yes stop_codon:yes gene_type:complete
MRPVGKYIIVQTDSKSTTTTSKGLILDNKNREDIRYKKALVLEVGDEVVAISKDNEIYYDKHAGFDVDVDNNIYKIIKEQDIVIVL